MENSKKGGSVNRPTIFDGTKNPLNIIAEGNSKYCEDQVEYDAKENITEYITILTKILRKVLKRLDMRYGNNFSTNIQDN